MKHVNYHGQPAGKELDHDDDHKFTAIAPESQDRDAAMWFWCRRCGALQLGQSRFSPGRHQKKGLKADLDDREPCRFEEHPDD